MARKEPLESGNGQNQDDYHFIKETIKKRPLNIGGYFRRAFIAAVSGVLFGCGAAFAFTVVYPIASEKFAAKEDVSLSDARPGPVGTGTPTAEADSADTARVDEKLSQGAADTDYKEDTVSSDSFTTSSIEIYEAVYQDAVRIAEQPMKAMVRIVGLTGDSDLLDDSFLTYGDEEGVVFLNNQTDLYILTNYKGLNKAENIRVTFSNGAVAEAILCKADSRTGMAVVRVPLNRLTDQEQDEIYVASLSDSYSLNNEKPVVAIGSPSGNYGSIVYGLITSTSGRMRAADCEYSLLGTNIMGSSESSGVLLDMEGKITGIIVRTQEDENILKAVSIAQLRSLIESLSNGEKIRYLGIRGASITDSQSQNLDIPQGLYVDAVENDSPAMIAGVQNGDIITKMNDKEMKDMQSYMTELQKLAIGDKTQLTVCRRDSEGEYVEMEFKLTVEEK